MLSWYSYGMNTPPDPKSNPGTLSEGFRRLASSASIHLGTPWAFIAAVVLIIGWAVTGPFFGFGETWQLVINTGTTIITFLMVFLIQSTQNRDSKAIHLKLDELIRSSKARNIFADLENATDQELETFQREFTLLRKRGMRSTDAAVAAKQRLSNPDGEESPGDRGSSSDAARLK
jgi:low affinity Fe/Cu permease